MLTFVIGSGRCGSTLLYEVLACHPHMGFVSTFDNRWPLTLRWVRRHSGAIYRQAARHLGRNRLPIRPSEAHEALNREVSPSFVGPFRDLTAADVTPWLASRLRRFFGSRAAAAGTDHFMHKLTLWPRAAFLHGVFPDARFVHVVRDGRAVANSLIQMPWWLGYRGPSRWHLGPLPDEYAKEWDDEGRSLVHLAGIAWKLLMDSFETARDAVPSNLWLEVRYEDLVSDPRKHMEAILAFLGLPWTPAFEQGFARQRFSKGRAEAFRTDLTPAQLTLLNRSLSEHLHRFGYSA